MCGGGPSPRSPAAPPAALLSPYPERIPLALDYRRTRPLYSTVQHGRRPVVRTDRSQFLTSLQVPIPSSPDACPGAASRGPGTLSKLPGLDGGRGRAVGSERCLKVYLGKTPYPTTL